jgi:hypothetical protein
MSSTDRRGGKRCSKTAKPSAASWCQRLCLDPDAVIREGNGAVELAVGESPHLVSPSCVENLLERCQRITPLDRPGRRQASISRHGLTMPQKGRRVAPVVSIDLLIQQLVLLPPAALQSPGRRPVGGAIWPHDGSGHREDCRCAVAAVSREQGQAFARCHQHKAEAMGVWPLLFARCKGRRRQKR